MEKHTRLCSVGRSVCKKWSESKAKLQKRLPVKSSKKAFVLCKWIWGNELLLPSSINDGNDAVKKVLFPPNFQAC